ncbi:MAG TPA: HNH endonuclease signature motif containing protein [Pirellulales bacterium]|nr:HNH endonuclease signature motif containing protein [Pirellulales bacterium]
MASDFPPWFLDKLNAVQAKRARTVIQHILKYGEITSEDLKEKYKYHHPPRAIRDVREQGIALDKFPAKDSAGRAIAGYRFADPSKSQGRILTGRKLLSKSLKVEILHRDGSKCAACSTAYDARYLQVDHRVPYEVQGDSPGATADEFMALCGSCNRAKSWSCEHCENWLTSKDPNVCLTCYWGNPTSYTHIALAPIRRIDLVWLADEVAEYEGLLELATRGGTLLPDYVKKALRRHVANATSAAKRPRK